MSLSRTDAWAVTTPFVVMLMTQEIRLSVCKGLTFFSP